LALMLIGIYATIFIAIVAFILIKGEQK
jgi:hypothetical protein